MPCRAQAEGWRLLRVLLIWLDEVSADARTVSVLLLTDKRLPLFPLSCSWRPSCYAPYAGKQASYQLRSR